MPSTMRSPLSASVRSNDTAGMHKQPDEHARSQPAPWVSSTRGGSGRRPHGWSAATVPEQVGQAVGQVDEAVVVGELAELDEHLGR